MRAELVFTKTARGIEELEHRTVGLGATARRLLILIDGRRNVGELIHDNARSMDVVGTLEQLQSQGLIGEPGATPPATESVAPTGGALSLRHALVEMARSVLGEQHAARVAAKLESLPENDADALGRAIDNCARLIRLTIDEDKAEDFRRQAAVILRGG